MKKVSLYIASLMVGAIALTGCDDTTDGGVMQENPQLPEFLPEYVTVNSLKQAVGGPAWVDLGTETGIVPLVTYTTSAELPEGAEVSFEMQVSDNDAFSNPRTISLVQAGSNYGVEPQLWDDAFRSLFGKAPAAKMNYIRFAGYINVGSQRSRIGTVDTWFAPSMINVTPIDLGIKVEDAYYLVGTANGWDLATAIKFDHSDKNVYDDPVFTLSIDVTADQAQGGWWWKIVPQSAFEAQDWGGLYGVEVDGDTSLSGNLYEGGNAGQLKTAGQQLFTIDMLSCTYSVTNAVSQLYTPGNSNGWNIGASSVLTTTDFTNYSGFLYLNGEWLLTPAANWDNKYALGEGGEGTIAFNASSNLPVPSQGAGLYWTLVNIGSLTYDTTPITVIGMIGDFNGWGGDVEMTPSEDMLTWTGTLTVEEGQGWKFRCNNDWAINLGGSIDNLETNGANITCAPGTYTVTLSIGNRPYTATLTPQ